MQKLVFLVVGYSINWRRIIVNCLNRIGYASIVEATDGSDALGRMHTEDIDFIITNWIMPNMDGLEFVKAVRKDTSFKDMPILMVSTKKRRDDIIKALNAGVDNYIAEPFTLTVLNQKIDAILEKRRSES